MSYEGCLQVRAFPVVVDGTEVDCPGIFVASTINAGNGKFALNCKLQPDPNQWLAPWETGELAVRVGEDGKTNGSFPGIGEPSYSRVAGRGEGKLAHRTKRPVRVALKAIRSPCQGQALIIANLALLWRLPRFDHEFKMDPESPRWISPHVYGAVWVWLPDGTISRQVLVSYSTADYYGRKTAGVHWQFTSIRNPQATFSSLFRLRKS